MLLAPSVTLADAVTVAGRLRVALRDALRKAALLVRGGDGGGSVVAAAAGALRRGEGGAGARRTRHVGWALPIAHPFHPGVRVGQRPPATVVEPAVGVLGDQLVRERDERRQDRVGVGGV